MDQAHSCMRDSAMTTTRQHSAKRMKAGMSVRQHPAPDCHEVAFVWFDEGGNPFDVITVDPADGRAYYYDFENCRRDGQLYYCMSGFGRGVGHVGKVLGARHSVWWDDSLVRVEVTARKWWLPWRRRHCRGYFSRGLWLERFDLWLRNARRLDRLPANPFDDAQECDRMVYCKVCDDRMPDADNRPCEHLEWSDDHGDFIGEGADTLC